MRSLPVPVFIRRGALGLVLLAASFTGTGVGASRGPDAKRPAPPPQFNASQVVAPPEVIARHFPDPPAPYHSPGLRPGREDFPSHAEVLEFARALAEEHRAHVTLEIIGRSQQGRDIPALLFAASSGGLGSRPTVLVLGQQHGNEPGGGEGALALASELATTARALLDRVNVVIVPRANADGAERFVRATANGVDVNRDHLLLKTPEARALARLAERYRPQVVLDLHEFTVGDRWVRKFGVVQYYDVLLQAATVGQLHPGIARAAEDEFLAKIRAALAAAGQRTSVYYTTSQDPDDKVVSMGGVQPDTGRNVNGLRQAVSILIETRGVGIGRAHLARRVHAHVTAALAVIEEAARQGPALVVRAQAADREVAAQACRGTLVIDARPRPGRHTMSFLDAVTGDERRLEVEWRSAEALEVTRERTRPCGYVFAPDQSAAVEGLRALGVELHEVIKAADWRVERYDVVATDEGVRQDARGAIDDGAAIRVMTVRTRPTRELVVVGSYFVSLAQPLGSLVAAAMEPDSQNSFAANGMLDLDAGRLRRVMAQPARSLLRQLP